MRSRFLIGLVALVLAGTIAGCADADLAQVGAVVIEAL
jgi:hypothetical protein